MRTNTDPDRSPRRHQFLDQTFALVRSEGWIAGPPESPADKEIAATGRRRITAFSVRHALRPFVDRLRNVIDQRGTSIGAMLCSQWRRTSPDRW